MRLVRKARFFWVYPLAIWLFATAHTTEASLRLGILFVFLGEAIRLWANGYVGHVKVNSTQKDRQDPKIGHLITAGPYAYVRHPLYVGTFLIGLGCCIVVRNVFVAVGALLLFVILYREKANSEETLILEEWGKDYEAYQQAVPRWFPTLRRYTDRYGRWSWQGIRASKELKTLIWVVVCLVALYFREEFRQEHELFTPSHRMKQMLLALLLVGLAATDGILELLRMSRRNTLLNTGASP